MAITRRKWEVNIGDMVWVSSGGRGWRVGLVEKIGPKLVQVSEHGRLTPYYLDSGQRRDGYPGGFTTQAQRTDDERRHAVIKSLRETFGIEFDLHSSVVWTTEALELLFDASGEIISQHPG